MEIFGPCLGDEQLSRVEMPPLPPPTPPPPFPYPSYPGRVNFSQITLQHVTNRLHEKQTSWLGQKDDLPSRTVGSPSWRGPTFLHINTLTLARPAGSPQSRRYNQTCASAVLENQSIPNAVLA